MRYRILDYLEQQILRMQGKGFGSKSYRAEVRAAMPFLPQSGAIVLDAGANKGLWARELLRQAGPRLAKLYCVEPSRHNFDAINAIADARVVLVKKALSDAEGTENLYSDEVGSAGASLAERRLDHRNTTMHLSERVDVTTLDKLLEEQKIDHVDFAKFDIEGYEYRAFLGGQSSFARGGIKALAFEFGGCNIDTRTFFRDFWYFLTERGYRLAIINPIGPPRVIERYSESLEYFLTTNFIAWKPEASTGPSGARQRD